MSRRRKSEKFESCNVSFLYEKTVEIYFRMTAITNKGKKEEKAKTIKPRLQSDYETLIQQPIPNIVAHPLDATLLEWRFVVIGPQETPFESKS